MSEDLERRLRRVEDRIELSDLVATYGRAVDDRDVDLLESLYTEDAVFDSVMGPVRGRKEVVEYYLGRMRMYGPSFHIPHSQTVEFEGDDEARGVVTAHAELGMPDGAFWIGLRYHDHCVREESRWRFRERKVLQLYAMPLRELVDDYSAERRKRWPDTDPAVTELPESLPTWSTWVGSA
jgi:ketosteroid isomerase-like protein